MDANKAYILASGPVSDYGFILSRVPNNDAYVICADGGIEHCKKCGITPSILIGDLDSCKDDIDESVPVLKYPTQKDDTDTMLCIKYAIQNGYKNIEIFGAVGDRLDHTLANLQALMFCKKQGVNCILSDAKQTVFLVQDESVDIPIEVGSTVSIFSYSVKADDITLRGLKYPLKNATLDSSFPLGISNVALKDEISITVGSGTLLIVISH